MTGFNLAAMGTRGITSPYAFRDLAGDADGKEAHIRAYCDAHPLAYYFQAVLDLFDTLPMKKSN
jgi:hypothetical protein